MMYEVALILCRPRNKGMHHSTQQTAHIAACKCLCTLHVARCTPHIARSSVQLQFRCYRVTNLEAMILKSHHARPAPLGMPAIGRSISLPARARGCGHGADTIKQVPLSQLPVQSLGRPSIPWLPAIGGGGVCAPIASHKRAQSVGCPKLLKLPLIGGGGSGGECVPAGHRPGLPTLPAVDRDIVYTTPIKRTCSAGNPGLPVLSAIGVGVSGVCVCQLIVSQRIVRRCRFCRLLAAAG
jgi:hypothetical protein